MKSFREISLYFFSFLFFYLYVSFWGYLLRRLVAENQLELTMTRE